MSLTRIMNLLVAGGAAVSQILGQQYVISTYAGGVPLPTTPVGALGDVISVATDAKGSIYIASSSLNSVFKLGEGGALTRVAGNLRRGYSGDGGPATSAQLYLDLGGTVPAGLALGDAGDIFIADIGNNLIRRVSPRGIITTVAGGGAAGLGDGAPAAQAQLSYPAAVAVDATRNLYIADLGNNRIRKVATSGIITTVAGDGHKGLSGDGGLAVSAGLNQPHGLAVDSAGNLFIADSFDFSIRKVSPEGIIATVAGNGTRSFSSDGGDATSVGLDFPTRLAVDEAGNLFVTDGGRVRKVSPNGTITTAAGDGTCCFSGDGAPATAAQVFPIDVAADMDGNLFIAGFDRIRKVSASGIISTVAVGGNPGDGACCFSGDGGPATSAQLFGPRGVASDRAGNLFIADPGNFRVRKVSSGGVISTVAGNGTKGSSGDGGPATSAQLNGPQGLAVDTEGNLLIADSFAVRKVSPGGTITTVIASGTVVPGDSAALFAVGVAVDRTGNVFIADFNNRRVRKASPSGMITTVAGNGAYGYSGDGGPATSAELEYPVGVVVDDAGNLFIADQGVVRKVSTSGTITTVAGGGTLSGSASDGGPATNALLSFPYGLALDASGNLFIADPGANFVIGEFGNSSVRRIFRVSPGGVITNIAGNGMFGSSGEGGLSTRASFNAPTGVAVDNAGNVYVADAGEDAIRILRPASSSVLIAAVVDAASQHADPVSPGKVVVIYGAGLGPSQLIQNQSRNGLVGAELSGTMVSFNGVAAPILYTSATQVAAIVPYAIGGSTALVKVSYQGETSADFTVPVAIAAPSVFTVNQAGWGQAAAINAADGTANGPPNPIKIGGYISLYATGEGQTTPGGADGKLGGSTPTLPRLPVNVTVGGIAAPVQYAGGAPGQVAGLMQVNVQIPSGVPPGGYVPIVLQVGNSSTTQGVVWIAVSAN